MKNSECHIPDAFSSYGDDVFSVKVIERLLPKKVASKLLATMRDSKPLDPSIADDVAEAMKTWALSKGATHFTHWFQPLTGGTAEKHDSFIEVATQSSMIVAFSGRNLIHLHLECSLVELRHHLPRTEPSKIAAFLS